MASELDKLKDMERQMLETAAPEAQDPEEAARSIAMQILTAETIDAVLTPSETMPWINYLTMPVTLRDMRLNRSGMEEGAPVYGLFDVVVEQTGEQVLVTCGGRNVMAQALRLMQLDGLPARVALIEAGKATAQGYKPLWLQAAAG